MSNTMPNLFPTYSGTTKPTLVPAYSYTALAVDDDRVMLHMLEEMLDGLGFNVITANNGKEALTILESNQQRIDVVVLDREMPQMNGIELVKKMKSTTAFRDIPVIMQTALDRPEQVEEGMEAGVFYYLGKPLKKQILTSVVQAALREAQQHEALQQTLDRQEHSLHLMDTCRFRFRTLAEAQNLAGFLATLFPEPARVLTGMAELMTNAVEHGNLGIGYERKTELLRSNTWHQEVERLLSLPQNQERFAEAIFKRKADGLYIQITDDGEGFEWRNYLAVDPARASDSHGRGIAQANMLCFDKLRYNAKGNQVLAMVKAAPDKTETIAW